MAPCPPSAGANDSPYLAGCVPEPKPSAKGAGMCPSRWQLPARAAFCAKLIAVGGLFDRLTARRRD